MPTRTSRAPRQSVAVVLLILGIVAAPLSILASRIDAFSSDPDAVSAAFAPLAKDAAVQDFVTDRVVLAITESSDFDSLVSTAAERIVGPSTNPLAAAARDTLVGAAVDAITSALRAGVGSYVRSDRFAAQWERALPVAHAQLASSLRSDPDAIIALDDNGTLVLRLGPIVAAATTSLAADGVTFADRIPEVHSTVELGDGATFVSLQRGYRIFSFLAVVLPVATVVLLLLGVLLAADRSAHLRWGSTALAAVTTVFALASAAVLPWQLDRALPPAVPLHLGEILQAGVVGPVVTTSATTALISALLAAATWTIHTRSIRQF